MATLQFIQAQPFKLAGSGASIGDTTLVLQSMIGIDSSNIVTADIGSKGYGTLEPGNGTNEESITFTGITQNANGTATLTGVKTALFKSPYTETSGLAKTHAGASTFILSNEAAFYAGILNYIDTAIIAGGVPATTSVNGLTKMSVAPVSAPSPIAVGDNDTRMPTQGENDALVGTSGTPSSSNKYVTSADVATTKTNNAIIRAKSDGTLDISFLSLATPSNTLVISDDGSNGTTATSATLLKSIQVNRSGSVRIKFVSTTSITGGTGHLFVNGVDYSGPITVNSLNSPLSSSYDVPLPAGSVIQLYGQGSGGGASYAFTNFRIYYDLTPMIEGSVIL